MMRSSVNIFKEISIDTIVATKTRRVTISLFAIASALLYFLFGFLRILGMSMAEFEGETVGWFWYVILTGFIIVGILLLVFAAWVYFANMDKATSAQKAFILVASFFILAVIIRAATFFIIHV